MIWFEDFTACWQPRDRDSSRSPSLLPTCREQAVRVRSSRGGTGSGCRVASQRVTTTRTLTTDGSPAFLRTGTTAGRCRQNPPRNQKKREKADGPGHWGVGLPLRVVPTLEVRSRSISCSSSGGKP